MEKQFDSEGSGARGSWAPLSEKYAAWKSTHYPGMPILQATGTMKDALTNSASPYAHREVSGNDFNFGTSGLDYASYHQTGTSRMPDRPPFDFSPDFERDLLAAALEGAREAMAESRLMEYVEVVD